MHDLDNLILPRDSEHRRFLLHTQKNCEASLLVNMNGLTFVLLVVGVSLVFGKSGRRNEWGEEVSADFSHAQNEPHAAEPVHNF